MDDSEYGKYEVSFLKKLADDIKIAIKGSPVQMTVF